MSKERPGSFATVSAGKAIGPAEFLIVNIPHLGIKIFRRFLAQDTKEFFILLMLIFGLFREGS